MGKCQKCKKYWPDKFVTAMFIGGGYMDVDPECALKLMQEVHGFEFKSFQGEVAQQMLEDFREWKRRNETK